MNPARLLTLLILSDVLNDSEFALMNICISASALGTNMRIATNPAHAMKFSYRDRFATRVLVVVGLNFLNNDAYELISTLSDQSTQGVIVIVDSTTQFEQALATGADLVLPSSVNGEKFFFEIQQILNKYSRKNLL